MDLEAREADLPLREVELRPAPPARPMRPMRPMRIVGLESVAEIVERAFGEAVDSLSPALTVERARLLAARARRAFLDRLRASGRPVRGMAKSAFLVELERSKSELLVARDRLRDELAGLTQRREVLQEIRSTPEGGSARAAGPLRFEPELARSLRSLLALARDPSSDLPTLERVGMAQIQDVLALDRERLGSHRSAELASQIDVYERRIEKLRVLLGESERALSELASLREVDPGLASIYRTVQGLDESDALASAKQDALDKIFQANLALRMALADLPPMEPQDAMSAEPSP